MRWASGRAWRWIREQDWSPIHPSPPVDASRGWWRISRQKSSRDGENNLKDSCSTVRVDPAQRNTWSPWRKLPSTLVINLTTEKSSSNHSRTRWRPASQCHQGWSGRSQTEEGGVHVNVEEYDYYDDVGDFSFLQAVLLQKGMRKEIYPGWILPDNQSTAEVFSNNRLVKVICYAGGSYITIHCNSGKNRVTNEEIFNGCVTVWYDKGTIANIYPSAMSEQSIQLRITAKGTTFQWWICTGRYSSRRAWNDCNTMTCPNAMSPWST